MNAVRIAGQWHLLPTARSRRTACGVKRGQSFVEEMAPSVIDCPACAERAK